MEARNVHSSSAPIAEPDATYEFLGRLLLFPMDEDLCKLVAQGNVWESLGSGGVDGCSIAAACNKIEKTLDPLSKSEGEALRRQLATEYTRFFVGPENQLIPPWESLYEGDRRHLFGHPVSEVRAFMRAHHLSSVRGDSWPEDHLGVELLILQELLGSGTIADEEVSEIADFVEEHPLWLVRKMNETAVSLDYRGSGFYRALLELIQSYLEFDLSAMRSAGVA